MSNEKPALSVATGFNGGVTVGIHADTWEEFVDHCRSIYGSEAGPDIADGLYAHLQRASFDGSAQLSATTVAQFNSQPAVYPAAPPFNSGAPAAGGPPPGQTCDPRDPSKTKWVPGGYSQAKQKAYQGFWAKP